MYLYKWFKKIIDILILKKYWSFHRKIISSGIIKLDFVKKKYDTFVYKSICQL